MKESRIAYLFILPQFIFFLVFLIYPVIEGFRLSLYEITYTKKFFIGLENYVSLLRDEIFFRALKNTLLMVFWTTLATVSIGFLISASIFDKRHRYVTFIRGSYYVPTIISMVVYATIWKWLLNPAFGVLNYVLEFLGLKSVNFLGDYRYVIYVLIALVSVMNIGQAIVLYVAAMRGIDVSLFESARIDGANRWQIITKIIFPQVRPTTAYLVVVNVIGVMKVFIIVNIMTSGGPNYASSVLMYLCYTEAFKAFNLGRASAIGVLMFVFTFVISMLALRLFRAKR
jgi:multiple sugar transport system permease protein